LESRLTDAIRVKADAAELVTFHSALPLKAGLDDLKVRAALLAAHPPRLGVFTAPSAAGLRSRYVHLPF